MIPRLVLALALALGTQFLAATDDANPLVDRFQVENQPGLGDGCTDPFTPCDSGGLYMSDKAYNFQKQDTSFANCKRLCGNDVTACEWKVSVAAAGSDNCTVTCQYNGSNPRSRSCK